MPCACAANAELAVLTIKTATNAQQIHSARSAGAGEAVYTFDIHLQGAQETIFFDI